MKKKAVQFKPIAKPYQHMSDEELKAEAPNPLARDLRNFMVHYRKLDKIYSKQRDIETLRAVYRDASIRNKKKAGGVALLEMNLTGYYGKELKKQLTDESK